MKYSLSVVVSAAAFGVAFGLVAAIFVMGGISGHPVTMPEPVVVVLTVPPQIVVITATPEPAGVARIVATPPPKPTTTATARRTSTPQPTSTPMPTYTPAPTAQAVSGPPAELGWSGKTFFFAHPEKGEIDVIADLCWWDTSNGYSCVYPVAARWPDGRDYSEFTPVADLISRGVGITFRFNPPLDGVTEMEVDYRAKVADGHRVTWSERHPWPPLPATPTPIPTPTATPFIAKAAWLEDLGDSDNGCARKFAVWQPSRPPSRDYAAPLNVGGDTIHVRRAAGEGPLAVIALHRSADICDVYPGQFKSGETIVEVGILEGDEITATQTITIPTTSYIWVRVGMDGDWAQPPALVKADGSIYGGPVIQAVAVIQINYSRRTVEMWRMDTGI